MKESFPYKAIVAVSEDGVIGRGGDLPWRLSGDLKWFKKITMGHIILMGRKTWESLPGALPKRENWVLSSTIEANDSKIRVFKKIQDALDAAKNQTLFIIGGGELYRQTLPLCDELYVSEVHKIIENGDAFFPPFKNEFQVIEKLFESPEFTLNRWIRKPS